MQKLFSKKTSDDFKKKNKQHKALLDLVVLLQVTNRDLKSGLLEPFFFLGFFLVDVAVFSLQRWMNSVGGVDV